MTDKYLIENDKDYVEHTIRSYELRFRQLGIKLKPSWYDEMWRTFDPRTRTFLWDLLSPEALVHTNHIERPASNDPDR
ncbi:hypothetical protein Rctr197k_271 [Virus Rctr197k]|nr:hypothetical protein Rctr197k_271 [Virus Rctr197k]